MGDNQKKSLENQKRQEEKNKNSWKICLEIVKKY